MSMMNRLGNSKNPYQTDAKRVLCVCSAGLLRSPTAANVIHSYWGFNTRSAGMTEEYALIPVDEVLVSWADEIVCMDKYQCADVREKYDYDGTIINLNIPDQYRWNDDELRALIKKNYKDAMMLLDKEK